MKPLYSSLMLIGALSAVGAFAQPTPAPKPVPPRAVQPMPPVPPTPPKPAMMPAFQQPMQPYRFMAPIGNQAMYVFEVIRTNKDELKVTDAQWKAIQDARDADQKTRMDRSMQTINARRDLQDLADADAPDAAKIEAKIREMKKAEGDDMLADFKLTTLYRKTLTAEQRERIKTLSPKFEPYMPSPGRPGMPGQFTPGAPGIMPGGNPPGAMGTPGGPPMIQPVAPTNPPRP